MNYHSKSQSNLRGNIQVKKKPYPSASLRTGALIS